MSTVRIIQLDAATLAALAEGDFERAGQTSPVPLTPACADPDWRDTWALRARQVVDDPPSQAWVTGVVWSEERGQVVGRAGFHGPPDPHGMVEVGYSVDPDLRRQGLGWATLQALLARAHAEPAVRTVRASVGPWNAASLALVARAGFVQVGEQWDEEDGLELVFERPS